jgi:alpha-D-ribose 1-methylphosphonate 5-triphosphate synthase subunit PhnG
MTIAKTAGVKTGKAAGWLAATAWKGTVLVASGLGEAGSGFIEGAEVGWDDRCAVMDAKIAKRKAELAARKAEQLAAKAEPAPVAAPVAA